MIRVLVRREASGDVVGLSVSGHAGYAPRGRDIVCAAVSALAQTALLGLRRVGASFELDETGGRIAIALAPGEGQRSRDVLATTALGLAAIAERYGEFVSLREESAG